MYRLMRASVWALMLVMTLMMTAGPGLIQTAYADINGENGETIPAAHVRIPVKHIIAGDKYTGADKFEFVLTAEEDKCPMPDGSNGKTRTVTVSGDSDPDFGEIVLEYPDSYRYMIKRTAQDCRNLETDDEVYSVLIVKFNDGSYEMVMFNGSGEKVDKIVYTDVFTAPSAGSPRTGDSEFRSELLVYSVLTVAAATGLLVLAVSYAARRRDIRKRGGSCL